MKIDRLKISVTRAAGKRATRKLLDLDRSCLPEDERFEPCYHTQAWAAYVGRKIAGYTLVNNNQQQRKESPRNRKESNDNRSKNQNPHV